jgi:hypothetical protein
MSAASATESLDSEIFAFFHFGVIIGLDNVYRFSTMDLIKPNGMTGQVSDRLYYKSRGEIVISI